MGVGGNVSTRVGFLYLANFAVCQPRERWGSFPMPGHGVYGRIHRRARYNTPPLHHIHKRHNGHKDTMGTMDTEHKCTLAPNWSGILRASKEQHSPYTFRRQTFEQQLGKREALWAKWIYTKEQFILGPLFLKQGAENRTLL